MTITSPMSRIDYDLSKIKAVVFDIDGVLSPTTVPMSEDGNPARMVNVRDGYALQFAIKHGFKIAIISGGTGDSLLKRYNKLGINDVYLGAGRKIDILSSWMEANSLNPDEVAYVGDDIPDYEPMLAVGLKVTPRDGAWQLKEIATYISPVDGGHGVARDLLEQILTVKGLWMKTDNAFGW